MSALVLIYKKLFFLILFLSTSLFVFARVSLFINNKEVSIYSTAKYFEDTSAQRNIERYLFISQFLKEIPADNISMSYKNSMYWISIDLSRLQTLDSLLYLEIHNPHINYLGAWLVAGNTAVTSYALTGDHLPFSSRNINHPQFVYKIAAKDRFNTLVLLVDKRNEQLHLPLNFFGTQNFIQFNRGNDMLSGLLAGISIFILLFTLSLYYNMREGLYVYYALYVLMVGGYIISDLGLSFMFLFPRQPQFADFARPLTISQAPIYYILFSRNLLDVKKHFPKIYRFTNWFIAGFIVLFICGFTLVPNTGSLRVFWLVLMQIIMAASIIPVFIFAFLGYRKKIKYAGYIIIASAIFTFFTQIYMQYLTGNLPDVLLTRHAINIGFTMEISLLAFALSIRFKNYKREAENLLLQLNSQQEYIFKSVSEYQENEMNRLSGVLHDSIGAGLSSIKYNLEAFEQGKNRNEVILRNTIQDVSALTDEVRNISHSLSPVLLQKKGLLTALKDLIEPFNRTGTIFIQLESIGSKEATSFQNEIMIYRMIQELLQNAIKHAAATDIIIQIMIEEELISIFVEDNGKGCEEQLVKDGLGFTQIKGFVNFVNGSFKFTSGINKGCQVSIEFPIIPYESADNSVSGRRSPYVFGRG